MFFKNKKDKEVNNSNSNSMIKSENKIMPKMFEWLKKSDKYKDDSKNEPQHLHVVPETKNIFPSNFYKYLFKKNPTYTIYTQKGLPLQFETTNLKILNQRTVWEERIDTKYVANVSELDSLLQKMSTEYMILKHKGKCICDYTSEYMETADRSMFYAHQLDNFHRYKVRKRRYGSEDGFWLEVKEKKDGNLRKHRIFNPSSNDIKTFIRTNSPYESSDLTSVIFVYYERMTFTHKTLPLKITVDKNLRVKKNGSDLVPFNDLMIIEAKSRKNEAASIQRIIGSKHIKPCSVSKYCIGMATLYPELKVDASKPGLSNIKKISKNIKWGF